MTHAVPAASPVARRRREWPRLAAVALAILVLGGTATWLLRVRASSRPAPVAGTGLPASTVAARLVPAPRAPEPAAAPASSADRTSEPTGMSVTIRAARPTWVRTGVDGVFDHGGFLAAGQQRVLTGTRAVEVRTGDGGALLAAANGEPEAPLGKNGVDATRKWSLGDPRPSDPAPEASNSSSGGDAAPPAQHAPVATTGIEPPASPSVAPRDQIADAEGRWFEAWYRGDEVRLRAVQTAEFELVDQRPHTGRPGRGAAVERNVRSLQVDTWGDHAAASGVMIERVRDGAPRDLTSVFAETWVRRDGRWQLMGIRLTTPGETSTR